MPADRLLHPKAGHSRKVSHLTDLEYRVWTQYLLSADDFGVMRATAATLQADNSNLHGKPVKLLLRCLKALIVCGLLRAFDEQGEQFVYSHNWQTWQKVEYPRTTDNPKPAAEALAICDEPTRQLFDKHPGGLRRARPKDSERVSQTNPEDAPTTRAGGRAERLTANGSGLVANGSEGVQGEPMFPAMDLCARELVNLYPSEGRCGWHLVERPLFKVLTDGQLGPDPATSWEALKVRLEQHKRSHQWRVKGMVKRLDRWLAEGLYLAELQEQPVATLVSDKTARTLASGEAFVRGGQ